MTTGRRTRHPRDISEEAARKFGERLSEIRNRLGLSGAELSRRTNIDRNTLEKLEKGETKSPFLSTASTVTLVIMQEARSLGIELMQEIFAAAAPNIERSADFNQDGKEDEDDVPYCGLELARLVNELNLGWLHFWADGALNENEMAEMRRLHDQIEERTYDHKRLTEKVYSNCKRDRAFQRR